MEKNKSNKLLITGVSGAIIAAICCFTPILVIALGFAGLTAYVGVLDMILLPALFIFVGLILYALSKRKQVGCCAPKANS